jgi:hypothetical protein
MRMVFTHDLMCIPVHMSRLSHAHNCFPHAHGIYSACGHVSKYLHELILDQNFSTSQPPPPQSRGKQLLYSMCVKVLKHRVKALSLKTQ